jgi:hypothetical protein
VVPPPAPVAGYKVGRTPWGHPDLQGVWTSDAALGIGTARSGRFKGVLLDDEEFAQRVAQNEKSRIASENAVGSFRNDGSWQFKSYRQNGLIVEPDDGLIPVVTPEAEKRRAPRDRGTFGDGPFRDTDDFTLYDRCITRGVVGSVLPVVYGNGNVIVQTPDTFAISYEMIHDTRIIPLDGRPFTGIRSYLGESRGRWEGDVLVVETKNFTDKTSIGANGNGLRHSDAMKMTERFTRTDKDELWYEVTLDDPKTYTKPWKIQMPWGSPAGFQMLAYECHEGNYMLPAVLSGERAEDRREAEAAAKGERYVRKPVQFNNNAPLPADARVLGGGAEEGPPPAPVRK